MANLFEQRTQFIFTKTITNTVLVINASDAVTAVAINLVSGIGFYQGNKTINGLSSDSNDLEVSKPVTISASLQDHIEGLTIDCSAGGVIQIIAR